MKPDELLRKLKDGTDFGQVVASIEQRTKATKKLAFVAGAGLLSCLLVLVVPRVVAPREAALSSPDEVVAVMIRAAHALPAGSCELRSAARFLLACVPSGDASRYGWIETAIPGVARAGLGYEAEPWLRAALVSSSARVRKAAVTWYPVAVPDFRNDPAAAADFDAAVASLRGD